ncbi:unnamed protein product [Camellia sinensis]
MFVPFTHCTEGCVMDLVTHSWVSYTIKGGARQVCVWVDFSVLFLKNLEFNLVGKTRESRIQLGEEG